MGCSFHWSSSSSKNDLFMILFFSSKGIKFSIIRCLHATKKKGKYTRDIISRLISPLLLSHWLNTAWKRRNVWVFSCFDLVPQAHAMLLLHSLPKEAVSVHSRQWGAGTHFSFSSLVSSFWVCSSSWRSLMCSSCRSWISAFTACSLENNWGRQQEPQSQLTNVPATFTHKPILFLTHQTWNHVLLPFWVFWSLCPPLAAKNCRSPSAPESPHPDFPSVAGFLVLDVSEGDTQH